jgi:hypothetical protein
VSIVRAITTEGDEAGLAAPGNIVADVVWKRCLEYPLVRNKGPLVVANLKRTDRNLELDHPSIELLHNENVCWGAGCAMKPLDLHTRSSELRSVDLAMYSKS